jgi:hypothetical protein
VQGKSTLRFRPSAQAACQNRCRSVTIEGLMDSMQQPHRILPVPDHRNRLVAKALGFDSLSHIQMS